MFQVSLSGLLWLTYGDSHSHSLRFLQVVPFTVTFTGASTWGGVVNEHPSQHHLETARDFVFHVGIYAFPRAGMVGFPTHHRGGQGYGMACRAGSAKPRRLGVQKKCVLNNERHGKQHGLYHPWVLGAILS